jgi:hypothetical protein
MVAQIQGVGSMMGLDRQINTTPLTDDQKSQMQEILSQYDSSHVTTEDARSIMQAFRDAGIKPARGMKETIQAAGFDTKELLEKGRPQGMPSMDANMAGSSGFSLASASSGKAGAAGVQKTGGTPPTGGGPKPAASSSATESSSSANKIYDARDADQDGKVSFMEELLYSLQNPTEDKQDDSSSWLSSLLQQNGLSTYQQGEENSSGSISSLLLTA